MSKNKFNLFISYVEGRERPVTFESNRRRNVRVLPRATADPSEKAGLISFESACTLRKRKLAICGRSSRGCGLTLNTTSGLALAFRHCIKGANVHCFVLHGDAGVFFTSNGVVHVELASGKSTPQPINFKKQLSTEGMHRLPVLRTNGQNVGQLFGSVFFLFAGEDGLSGGVASVSLLKADHRVHNRIECLGLEVSEARRRVYFVSIDGKLYTCSFASKRRELVQLRVVDLSANLPNIPGYVFSGLAQNGDYLALGSYCAGSNPFLNRIDLLTAEDSGQLSYQIFSPPELNEAKKSLSMFAYDDPDDEEDGAPAQGHPGTNYIASLLFKRVQSMNLLLAACRYFAITLFHIDGAQIERLQDCDIGITESSPCSPRPDQLARLRTAEQRLRSAGPG